MKITLLVDNLKSWIMPYVGKLETELLQRGHDVSVIHDAAQIPEGECAFFLSCERIIPNTILARNRHNIVIHSSALPQGRGWSPLTWQILEGKNDITISLFEAAERVDAGPVYFKDTMRFEGHELIDEMQRVEGEKITALALKFVEAYNSVEGQLQEGSASYYPRRTAKDSELDPEKSIVELFDLLRVVDNERYPAFFRYRGHTYILKIQKDKDI